MAKLTVIVIACLCMLSATVSAQDDLPPVITPENVAQLKQIAEFDGGAEYGDIAWSPDSTSFVVIEGDGIVFYDVTTMTVQPESFAPDVDEIYTLSYSSDGETLYYAALVDDTVRVFSYGLETGAEATIYSVPFPVEVNTMRARMIRSADGRALVQLLGNLYSVISLEAFEGGEGFLMPPVETATFSPNSELLYVVGGTSILQSSAWLIDDGSADIYVVLQYSPLDSAFTSDNQYLVAAQPGRTPRIEFWLVDEILRLCEDERICEIRAYEPDFALSDQQEYEPYHFILNRDDSLVFAAYQGFVDGRTRFKVAVWDVHQQEQVMVLHQVLSPRPNYYHRVLLSPDNRFLAILTWDGVAQIWAVDENAD